MEQTDDEKYLADLEKKFAKAQKDFDKEMDKIYAAYEALSNKAAQLSEKYGVPAYFAGDKYVPTTMKTLFGDGDSVDEIFEEEIYDYRYGDKLPEGEWWSPSTC